MHIIIAAGIFPPDIGGPATYAEGLTRYCVSRGDRVTVLSFGDTNASESRDGYLLLRFSRKHKIRSHFRYLYTLLKLSRTAGMVYAQGPVAGGIQAFCVYLLTRKRYFVKITGDYAWEQAVARHHMVVSIDEFQNLTLFSPLHVYVLRMVQRMVTRHAACVIVPSKYLASLVAGWGVSREKVRVIYNSVEEHESSTIDRVAAKARLGVTGIMCISIGRLVPWKGFRTLIEVWHRVVHVFPDAKLYIIGSGPQEEELARAAAHSGVAHAIVFPGKKKHSELLLWYRAADLFVLNTGYEGLSHTIMEAMLQGTPCAVSDSGGNTELIEDSVSGVCFQYNDANDIVKAITHILADTKRAHTYAEHAADWMREHSYAHMLNTTYSILTKT